MTGLIINIVDKCINAAGAFAILSGIGLFFRGERPKGTLLIAALNICLGVAIPLAHSIPDLDHAIQPYARFVVVELVMLAGILSYVYQDKIYDPEPYSKFKKIFLLSVMIIPMPLHPSVMHFLIGVKPAFQVGGIFVTIMTFILNLVSIHAIKSKIRPSHMSRKNRLMLGLLILLSSGAVTSWLIGHLLRKTEIETLAHAIASVTGIYGYYLTQYSREFMPFVRYEVNRSANRRSNLDKVDVELVATQLQFAMKEKKLYHEWKLKMPSLAAEVGITQHQLSEYLNKVMKVNFNRYVNEYRISEAKELLRSGEHSVLDVCYLVGFNSLSAFSRAFREIVGVAPRDFKGPS